MRRVGRYSQVIKMVKEAEDLARSGALVLDDGASAIYFLWGQPSHAYAHVEGTRIEGDAALKEITLALAQPGKVTWRSKDVIPIETLRCNAEELIVVLTGMAGAAQTPARLEFVPDAAASTQPWNGVERRSGPALRYSLSEFPLLPSGASLWAEVPTTVVHLDVLIGTLQTVLVIYESESVRAAGIVHESERFDAIFIDPEHVTTGRAAWELMMAQTEGSVSAYEIEPDVARTLPVLWRNRIVHRDLDVAWINRNQFLSSQVGDNEDRAIIISTPDTIGISLFSGGSVVASYSTTDRVPRSDLTAIQPLLAREGDALITVLERIPEDTGDAYRVPLPAEAPQAEPQPEAVGIASDKFRFQPLDDSNAPPEPAPMVFEEFGRVDDELPEAPVAFRAEPVHEWHPEIVEYPAETADAGAEEPEEPESAAPEAGAVAQPAAAQADAEPHPTTPAPAAFMPPGSGVALGDLQSLLSSPQHTPQPQSNGDVYTDVIHELVAIGHRSIGEEFAPLESILTVAPHTAAGIRGAITSLRDADIPGQTDDQVGEMVREMLTYAGDRLTAI